jgi:exopolyphosphatase / guanosine-5'-triphosphate,3'-diphosphate pyrophosphatase
MASTTSQKRRMGRKQRYGVVDVGSNTVHLLVAECDGQTLTPIDDESTRLQLGADVALTGLFEGRKMRMATETVRGYVEQAQRQRTDTICLLGTQAVRTAGNGQRLARGIQDTTGHPLRVISPAVEARLGYLGTTLDLPDKRPRLIVDIGGGSTQLMLVDGKGRTHFEDSLPIGSVALPAKFMRHDPPRPSETERAELAVQQAVGRMNQRFPENAVEPSYGILIGGVGRRLARAGRLRPSEPIVRLWVERLSTATMAASAEAIEAFGAARFEDAEMLRAGALILRHVMAARGLQYCFASINGIREGAVLALSHGEEIGTDA